MQTEEQIVNAQRAEQNRPEQDSSLVGRGTGVGLMALSAAAVVGAAGLAHLDLPRGERWRDGALTPENQGDPRDRASGAFREATVLDPLLTSLAIVEEEGVRGEASPLPDSWPEGLNEEQIKILAAQRDVFARYLPTDAEGEGARPLPKTADGLVSEMLTTATGSYSADQVPEIAEAIATIVRTASIESGTIQKIDYILREAKRHPEGDSLCIAVLQALDSNTTLFRIAALHEDRAVANQALLALGEDHPAVAGWLATERTESFRNMLRNLINKESNVPLYDLIEQMIAQHDADSKALDDARSRIAMLEGIAEDLHEKLAAGEAKQAESEKQIGMLEVAIAKEKAALARAEEVQREQRRQLDDLRKKFEEEKRKNFVFIDDHSYRIIRQLTGAVEVASNSRNYNFRLPANAGELVLCVVTDGDLTDAQKRDLPMRLKRDKHNAEDKDIRKPLRHGDAWTADAYVSNGERFYVKHENGRTLHVAFYVVSEEEFTL